MANTTESTISMTAWTIGAVLSVSVIGGGVYLWRGGFLSQGSAAVEQATMDVAASAVDQAADAVVTPPVTTIDTKQELSLLAPELDLVRVDPDGSTLVAGRGQAGAEVSVLLDGDEVARQEIADGGEFAVFVTLQISNAPRVLSLLAHMDGQTVASDASFILAPVEATPEAASAAQQPSVADDPQEAPDIETAKAEPPKSDISGPQTFVSSDVAATVEQVEEGAALKQAATEVSEQVVAASNQAKDVLNTLGQTARDVSAPAVDTALDIVENVQPDHAKEEAEDLAGVRSGSAPLPNIVPDVATLVSPAQSDEPTADVTQPIDDPTGVARADEQPSTLVEAQEVAVPAETQTAPKPNTPDIVAADIASVATAQNEPNVAASAADAPVISIETPQAQDVVEQEDQETVPAVEATSAPNPASSIAVLRADNSGVSLIQPATPIAPDLVGKIALDTISYSTSGDVLLAGRARPAALVRVYLDNAVVADFQVARDGRWNGSLTSVAPGIYTLRVDEIDPVEGKVLSRLETPFKREAPEVLAPVTTAENGVAAPKVQAITVQQGDTLWAISNERYGSGFLFVRVFEANKNTIKDPDLIYPGQIFNLPE